MMSSQERGISTVVLAVALIVGLALSAGFVAYYLLPSSSTSTTGSQASSNYVLTDSPAEYFPNGYYVKLVNLSEMRQGTAVVVGSTPIRLEQPLNLEVKTSVIGGTTSVITMTVDYQCGTSMGGRMFFHAQLADGSDYALSYCLVLNSEVASAGWSPSSTWNLWQVSRSTAPTLALHMSGQGEQVTAIELWVGK
jgi:hypothetical protein